MSKKNKVKNTDSREFNIFVPVLDDNIRGALDERFKGKGHDYIEGYIQGVKDNTDALAGELLLSAQAVYPMRDYLAELTSGE